MLDPNLIRKGLRHLQGRPLTMEWRGLGRHTRRKLLESLARVPTVTAAMRALTLGGDMGDNASGQLTGVLELCSRLTTLDLSERRRFRAGPDLGWWEEEATLTQLPFPKQRLSAAGWALVAQYLPTSLTSINLMRMLLQAEGIRCLAAQFRRLPHLTDLNLESNRIPDNGFQSLADGPLPTTLERLWLGDNDTHGMAAVFLFDKLRHCSLRHLDLQNNQLEHTVGTTSLEVLAMELNYCTNITSVDLSHTDMDDNSLRLFADSLSETRGRLRKLSLLGNLFGAPGMSRLARILHLMTALEELGLGYTEFADAGIAALGGGLKLGSNIKLLDIRHTKFDWSGVTEFQQNNLSEGLAQCRALTCLHVSENELSVAAMGALLDSLLKLTELRHVNIGDNEVGPTAVGRLLRTNSQLQSLVLHKSNFRLVGAVNVGRAFLQGGGRHLTTLHLENNNLGCAGVRVLHLRECPALTDLDLSNNYIRHKGAAYLARELHHCTSITRLTLSNNYLQRWDPRQDFVLFITEGCLRHLSLDNTSLSDWALASIFLGAGASTTLKQLDVGMMDQRIYSTTARQFIRRPCKLLGQGAWDFARHDAAGEDWEDRNPFQ